jgi:hypothetical protein
MPLNFDPNALLAPGGIVSGLDNLGGAVVTALNRRAERKYALEAEKRRREQLLADRTDERDYQGGIHNRNRGELLTDRTDERGYQEKLHLRGRGEKLADVADERTNQDRLHTRGRTEKAADRELDDIEQAADTYSPTMADPYADLDEALKGGRISSVQYQGYRVRRDAAKSKYERDRSDFDRRNRPQQVSLPAAKTYDDPANPSAPPKLDVEARIADLVAAAQNARTAGNDEQADQYNRQARGLQAAMALGPEPEDDTPTRMKGLSLTEFMAAPEYQDLKVDAPGQGYNPMDIYKYDAGAGTLDFKERANSSFGSYFTDEADENYFEADPQRVTNLKQAFGAWRGRRGQELKTEHAKRVADYRAKRAGTMSGALSGPGTTAAPQHALTTNPAYLALSPEERQIVDEAIAGGTSEADALAAFQ